MQQDHYSVPAIWALVFAFFLQAGFALLEGKMTISPILQTWLGIISFIFAAGILMWWIGGWIKYEWQKKRRTKNKTEATLSPPEVDTKQAIIGLGIMAVLIAGIVLLGRKGNNASKKTTTRDFILAASGRKFDSLPDSAEMKGVDYD